LWKIKHKNWALLLSNAIFVILWMACLIGLLRHPYIGLALENTEETWRVITVDPYGEGARSSIRKGDIILQMDDLAPEQHSSVQKWHEVVDISSLVQSFKRKPAAPWANDTSICPRGLSPVSITIPIPGCICLILLIISTPQESGKLISRSSVSGDTLFTSRRHSSAQEATSVTTISGSEDNKDTTPRANNL